MRPTVTPPILLLLALSLPAALAAQEDIVIFLVRHAERADDEPREVMDPRIMAGDPPLSEAGKERAHLLATVLRDAGITHIHSTDYTRTRETARPTAELFGVDTSIYDASDLEAFATRLLSTPGTHLVVGHSNTTHDLVKALGGNPGPAIQPLEYDRLYMVIYEHGVVRTILLRFGEVSSGTGATGS